MIIQLKELFELDGETKQVSCEILPEELKDVSSCRFTKPVKVTGELANRAGIVTLSYCALFSLDHACDRCLKEFEQEYNYSFEHILVRSLNTDSDDYVLCGDNTLDLNELAVSDILLMLPTKILCREDCKGLCCVCGKDLNEGDCVHISD